MKDSNTKQILTAIESVKTHTTREVESVKDNNKEVLKSIRNLENKVNGMDKRIDKNTHNIKTYKKVGRTVFSVFLVLFGTLFSRWLGLFK